jgi:hypothetical protein
LHVEERWMAGWLAGWLDAHICAAPEPSRAAALGTLRRRQPPAASRRLRLAARAATNSQQRRRRRRLACGQFMGPTTAARCQELPPSSEE